MEENFTESEQEKELDYIQSYAEVIKRSPYFTIVVEGKDDGLIFRQIEDIWDNPPQEPNILVANGRPIALGIFKQLKDTPHIKKVAFIVDQDTWVHVGKPPDYEHDRLICTAGYSIENDIFIDRRLDDFMQRIKVHSKFIEDLDEYLKWYVLAINRVINDTALEGDTLDIHPNAYFKQKQKNELVILREHEVFLTQLYDEIKDEYHMKLRGKNLLDLCMWSMNGREDQTHKYNLKAIIEETVHSLKGENLNRIFEEVRKFVFAEF